jgi:hypothetical protein
VWLLIQRVFQMLWPTKLLQYVLELIVIGRAILQALRLKKPGMVFLKVISQEGSMLSFKLSLPAPGAADVIKRTLVIKIGDADPVTKELAGDALETELFEGEQDTAVVGTLVDSDDATPPNSSDPSEFSFVLADTIAPPKPGQIGLSVVSES